MIEITQSVQINLSTRCYLCGGPIAMTRDQLEHFKISHDSFYCLLGHCQSFKGGECDRLRRELSLAQEQANALATEKAQLTGLLETAEKTAQRLRERIEAGICPYCHRRFVQVERHMRSKHKQLLAAGGAEKRDAASGKVLLEKMLG